MYNSYVFEEVGRGCQRPLKHAGLPPRLYQGVTLSCRGSIGTCRALGNAKTAFQWMILEGQARLWQGTLEDV